MEESKKPKVKSITLSIGKKEIEMSPQECKALKEALDEMFPAPTKVVHEHHRYSDWWNYPPRPYVTYGNSTGAALKSSDVIPMSTTADGVDRLKNQLLSLKANY